MNENYEVVINSQTEKEIINIKELFQYKDLINLLVKRNLSLMYKQTILGPAWLILSPLLTSFVFSIIFGQFAGMSTDGVPHFIFYITGLTMWTLFSTALMNTSTTFTSNAHLFGKVYFPRLTVPISQAITSLINFGLQLIVVFAFVLIFILTGTDIHIKLSSIILVPVLALHAAMLATAFGLILAALTIKYRDLAIAINFVIQLWLYASLVIYPLSSTGGWMRLIILINPVSSLINNFRHVFLGAGEMVYFSWGLSAVITVVLLIIGCKMFNATQKTFIDKV